MVQLATRIAKMPWSRWEILPPPIDDNGVIEDPQRLLDWYQETWQEAGALASNMSKHHLATWKEKIRLAVEGVDMAVISKWLKGATPPVAVTRNGDVLADPPEVAKHLCEEWIQELSLPEDGDTNISAENLQAMIGHVKPYHWNMPQITADMLASTAKSRGRSAGGFDAISHEMVVAFPEGAWRILALVFGKVEASCEWPWQLKQVAAVAIPKAGQVGVAAARKQRIISITSQIYRLWATCRAVQMNRCWLAKAMPPEIFGGIPGLSAKSASFSESVSWDVAQAGGEPWVTGYVDASKCFDNLRFCDVAAVAKALGAPDAVLCAAGRWLEGHERTFVVKECLSPTVTPTRGILQGCPLSVTWACVWSASWVFWVKAQNLVRQSLRFRITVYLDDWSVGSGDHESLGLALGLTQEHFRIWGLRFNLSKSRIIHNHVASAEGKVPTGILGELAVASSHVSLGQDTGWAKEAPKAEERLLNAQMRIDRLGRLGLSNHHNLVLIGRYISPLLYAVDADRCDAKMVKKLEKDMKGLAWGKSRPASCWPMVLAIDAPSHWLSLTCRSFVEAAQVIHSAAQLEHIRSDIFQLWQASRIPRTVGTWSCFARGLLRAGAYLGDPGAIVDADGCLLAHIYQPKSRWLHAIRQLIRTMWLQRAASAQPIHFDTSPLFLDWFLTRSPKSRRMQGIATWHCRGLNTLGRCQRHYGDQVEGLCEHDCGEEDSATHRLIRCQGLREVRDKHGMDHDDCDYLGRAPRCIAESALWVTPHRDLEVPLHRVLGLWVQKEQVQAWMSKLAEREWS